MKMKLNPKFHGGLGCEAEKSEAMYGEKGIV
jgi:hypothetical protein